jgi:hypothetical protein
VRKLAEAERRRVAGMLYYLDAELLEEAEAVAVALLAVFGVAPGEVPRSWGPMSRGPGSYTTRGSGGWRARHERLWGRQAAAERPGLNTVPRWSTQVGWAASDLEARRVMSLAPSWGRASP